MKMPLKPPDWWAGLADATSLQKILRVGIKPTVDGRYLHWDKLRQLQPPDGLSHEEWWAGIKFARQSLSRLLPIRPANEGHFQLAMPDPAWEMVHLIDQKASGEISFAELVANPQSRRRYLVSSLIEEAITSSQLEGATTTGRVAKEMIKSGRRPRTVSERMILNNYRAMSQITEWSAKPISKALILELHKVVTHDTLENPADEGRLQRPGEDRVVVLDREDGKVLYSPPPAGRARGASGGTLRVRERQGF